MMLEINLTLNSKMLFLFKDLLENIRKKKVYAFRFLRIQKAKDKFGSQNLSKNRY